MTDTAANSGDGSRPSTDGGVDNMGAGEKFTGEHTAAGGDTAGPAPVEKMQKKRKDAESVKHDDSAAYHLHEDVTPTPNTEPATPEQVISSSDPSRRG